MDADEEQIRQLIARWHRATAAGDLPTVLTLMTDDAVFLTPGGPPMTKDAFAAAFASFAGRARVEAAQEIQEIHAAGDLAYCWSHMSVVMKGIETRDENRRTGHVLTVFRKSAGGAWLLSRDANLMAPGTPKSG
jgi:uncharacterized protein (TIGR02246 family)